MQEPTKPWRHRNQALSLRVVASDFDSWHGIRGFVNELSNAFFRVDAMGLAKQVAFSVVFALLPTVFVLVSVAALFEKYLGIGVTAELRTYITTQLPDNLQPILIAAIDQAVDETSATAASITGLVALGLALWGGMGGVATLVEATNRAYGVRNVRPFQVKRLLTLFMTIALTLGIVLSIVVSLFGEQLLDKIATTIDRATWVLTLGEFLRIVIPISVILLALLLLYHYAPVTEQQWRFDLPGAVFSTIFWIVLLELSGFITARLNFASVYGAASGFMLLLYILNFAGTILIVGAAINGVLGSRYDYKRYDDLARNPEKIRYVESMQEVAPPPLKVPFLSGD